MFLEKLKLTYVIKLAHLIKLINCDYVVNLSTHSNIKALDLWAWFTTDSRRPAFAEQLNEQGPADGR